MCRNTELKRLWLLEVILKKVYSIFLSLNLKMKNHVLMAYFKFTFWFHEFFFVNRSCQSKNKLFWHTNGNFKWQSMSLISPIGSKDPQFSPEYTLVASSLFGSPWAKASFSTVSSIGGKRVISTFLVNELIHHSTFYIIIL